MKDYSKYNKDEILKILSNSYSIEEFMNLSGIKSLDKSAPRTRFQDFFGINIREIINSNKIMRKQMLDYEFNNRMVECDYCHNLFRFGDHPSNNRNKHNFCCNDHKNKYIASFSKGKTKICKCFDCGCDVVVDVHVPNQLAFCHDCLNKHDYSNPTRREFFKKRDPIFCPICGKETINHTRTCSLKCDAEYRYREYIKRWKAGLETGMKGTTSISSFIRRYILEKYNNKCAKCGWCEINPTTGKSPLEIEHIDGNFMNNNENNLILLCPNCHSLTPTYRSLNSGHGRPNRRKYKSISDNME